MATSFTGQPEHKHHVAAIVLIAILAVIIAVVALFGSFQPTSSPTIPGPATSTGNITDLEVKKLLILSTASSVEGSTTLSVDQKNNLINLLDGDRIKKYNFTAEQIQMIVNAINKQ